MVNEPLLDVTVAGIHFKTPLIAASGTFGYGLEYQGLSDYAAIGGVVVKGLYLEPRDGCAPPRIWETASGMLNAIGLQGVGIHAFVSEKMPRLRELPVPILVNICGNTLEEYASLAEILNDVEGVAGIELNISCPNVHKGGILFGCDPEMASRVTERVRSATELPVIPKLSPNVSDIAEIARRVVAAGADALSLINTIPAMAIDVETRKPRLANIVGGLSGPAIKPIALRLVHQTAQAVDVPVIGMGGIAGAEDALEFFLAGATAVQIGTMNFVDPSIWGKTLEGMKEYCCRHELGRITELTGGMQADVTRRPGFSAGDA